ncbi:XRE family transcriptional regulator [Streptomyces sp. NPDC047014]|uniref:XRE family transcriptional regulator n=1 Tax=Streptomyces sp. NPDC047014 TaxID=3155736 RepID=UPI0033FA2300
MDRAPNRALVAWMQEAGYSSADLAEEVNRAVGELTGRPGGLDDSSIRGWRSGRVKCPKSAQLAALELISGRTAAALGFVRRSRPAPHQEPPVKRRAFLSSAALAAAAVGPPPTVAPRRVGMADVARIQQRFADVIASDHRHGGQLGIERHAAALADDALTLLDSGSATQRVRASMYGSAVSFRSSAMWAAIDGRRFADARNHMRVAQELAELSGDSTIKFRIWSHAGTMYRHMGRPAEAAAANDVARGLSLCRKDPVFASLGLARHGAIHAATGDRQAARRAFGQAEEVLRRADPGEPRPVWLNAFYDVSEIDSLALSAHLSLGDWARAEAHGHRCLAGLRPYMARSRAIATARLARAQLEQREAETAVSTAMLVPAAAGAGHPRVARMLGRFTDRLGEIAPPGGCADAWRSHRERMAERGVR